MVGTVLSVQNATKRFGGLVAVNNLSFEVGRDELMGIIGPNGSGKTTMMNLISGALRLSEGSISLEGRFISTLKADQINQRGVARTFQLVRVLPGLSVAENCMAGMVFGHRRLWGDQARYEAGKLLERVGLAGQETVPVGSLTYIDQKRLDLSRALLPTQRCCFLTNGWPGSGRPASGGHRAYPVTPRGGVTIILVEHVMDAIRSLCDRCRHGGGKQDCRGGAERGPADPEVVKVYIEEDM